MEVLTRLPSLLSHFSLTVGDVNTTLFSGTMNWVSLVSETYWTIPLDNVAVGSTALGITANNAVIDTYVTLSF